MNSARKKIAKRIPLYSVWNPPTSSCSASTRSKGGWFVSAIGGDEEDHERDERGEPVPVGHERVPAGPGLRRRRCPGSTACRTAPGRRAPRGRAPPRRTSAGRTPGPRRAAGTSSPTTSRRASRRTARGPTSPARTGRRSGGRRPGGSCGARRSDTSPPMGMTQNIRNAGRIERYGASRKTGRSAESRDRLLLEEQLDAVGERLEDAVGPARSGRPGSACRRGPCACPDVEHHDTSSSTKAATTLTTTTAHAEESTPSA